MTKLKQKRQWTVAEIRKVRKAINEAFDAASEMIGGCYDPDEMDEQRDALEQRRKLVLEFVRDASPPTGK